MSRVWHKESGKKKSKHAVSPERQRLVWRLLAMQLRNQGLTKQRLVLPNGL